MLSVGLSSLYVAKPGVREIERCPSEKLRKKVGVKVYSAVQFFGSEK